MRSLGCVIIQNDGALVRRDKFEHSHTEREYHVKMQKGKMAVWRWKIQRFVAISQRMPGSTCRCLGENRTLPKFQFGTSNFWNCETINFYCFKLSSSCLPSLWYLVIAALENSSKRLWLALKLNLFHLVFKLDLVSPCPQLCSEERKG